MEIKKTLGFILSAFVVSTEGSHLRGGNNASIKSECKKAFIEIQKANQLDTLTSQVGTLKNSITQLDETDPKYKYIGSLIEKLQKKEETKTAIFHAANNFHFWNCDTLEDPEPSV